MSGVTLKNVVKRYGDVTVIHGVDLQINQGEFCVFVGPSGCGKSTLLRMIAGLEEISDGVCEIEGVDVTHADPADRGVAMVFQSYALYPHMTVRENMGFGLKMGGTPRDEIKARVDSAADILKLGPLLDRKPKDMSGGQRQRVAIGRAIVRNPKVFLFDEPLSNLDAELRVEMRVEIARLHQEIGATMVYVTHDQTEAMTLADKIVVLRAGRVEQVGAPLELYDDPNNQFVAGFIGSPRMNFIEGGLQDGAIRAPALGESTVPAAVSGGTASAIGLRPEHLVLSDDGPVRAKLDVVEHLGGASYLHCIAASGEKLVVESNDARGVQPGDALGLSFDPGRAYLFDGEGMRVR